MAVETTMSVARAGAAEARGSFLRLERLVLLMGAAAFGGLFGFCVAVATGRQELWVMAAGAGVILAFALHLTAVTLSDALARDARGCAAAATLHAAALLAWPMTSMLTPAQAWLFWIAPAGAFASLALFASCWSGPPRAVYRVTAQAALIAMLAAHQGVLVVMGG